MASFQAQNFITVASTGPAASGCGGSARAALHHGALRGVALAACALLIGALAAGGAQAASNPVDTLSNPGKLRYSDVEMEIPDYDVPFKRTGMASDPAVFRQIVPGLPAPAVQGLIGPPLARSTAAAGTEWDYHITFLLPRSENYIVCQYKVVFDAAERVSDAVWRRRQCMDIAQGVATQ